MKFLSIILLFITISGCNKESYIYGKWQADGVEGAGHTLEFFSDHSGVDTKDMMKILNSSDINELTKTGLPPIIQYKFRWKLLENDTVKLEYRENTFSMKIKGNKLLRDNSTWIKD